MAGWTVWPDSAFTPLDPTYLGDPHGISAYAHEQTDAANGFLLQLGTLAGSLAAPSIVAEFPTNPSAPPQLTTVAPTLMPIVWTSPEPALGVHRDTDDRRPAAGAVRRGSAGAELRHRAHVRRDRSGRSRCRCRLQDPGLTVNLPSVPSLLSINVSASAASTCRRSIPTRSRRSPSWLRRSASMCPGAQYTSSAADQPQALSRGRHRQRRHRAQPRRRERDLGPRPRA
jgi:hypothetical protein